MDWESAIRPELTSLAPYEPGLRARDVRDRTPAARILKLSSNEYPLGPFPSAIRGIESVLPRLNRYPDGMARALRRELAKSLGVAMSEVVVGSGSNELIRLIAQVVLRPGDEVVFAWPSFVVYPQVTQMFGAVAVKVPLGADDAHDLEAMAAAVTPRTRIIFLCNPNNPTGTIYRREAFERFLRAVPGHVLVVVDEAYREFVTDEGYPDALASFGDARPIAVLRTFSKIYSLAGLRIGYGALPEPLARAVDTVREPFNVSTVAQVAAYYSLEDVDEVERRRNDNL
ncbi:MAG TPA: aminotransferase class I/II-fold pyridoxal phosphate-dependent enzyme, partial [Coriobacteriia bacterium]|nr:aminotransferase class I/II-fold pyridoxal phosphate-dependent enzyme [Coriobacteriia bacterium]